MIWLLLSVILDYILTPSLFVRMSSLGVPYYAYVTASMRSFLRWKRGGDLVARETELRETDDAIVAVQVNLWVISFS